MLGRQIILQLCWKTGYESRKGSSTSYLSLYSSVNIVWHQSAPSYLSVVRPTSTSRWNGAGMLGRQITLQLNWKTGYESKKGSSTSYLSLYSSVNVVWHHPTCPSSDQLQQVAGMEPRQRLRSLSSPVLVVPATRRSSLADRAFLVAAARAWNSLPSTVTAASTLHSFRQALKTHLFTSFPPSQLHRLHSELT